MIKFGLLLTKIERGLHPQRLACEAEASGFDSFYLPENSHVPLKRPGTKKKSIIFGGSQISTIPTFAWLPVLL